MLLKTPCNKDYIFYGTDDELQALIAKDVLCKKKVIVLGEVPKERRIKEVDYISNVKMINRVVTTFDFIGDVSPYTMIYDLKGGWKFTKFFFPANVFSGPMATTGRIKRVTKDQIVEEMMMSNVLTFRMKRKEYTIYK